MRSSLLIFALATALTHGAETPEGYYKDIFMDAGYWQSRHSRLAAVDYLGLKMEYVNTENKTVQNNFIAKMDTLGWKDDNGALLYPDGGPRFRMVYVGGGDSRKHGASLGDSGRQAYRNFVKGGGSYSGSCAGMFLVAQGRNPENELTGREIYPNYFWVWPGRVVSTGLITDSANSALSWTIPEGSPLLKYSDYGGDHHIVKMWHYNGPYVDDTMPDFWAPGTEVLARYDYPVDPIHGHVSAFAYKKDSLTGRLVPIGSHPEYEESGERRDLFVAVLSYALEGVGVPRIKGTLVPGHPRIMNDNAAPGHEKIGDLQYHHFTIEVKPNTPLLTIELQGAEGYDFSLFARPDSFAFKGKPGVVSSHVSGAAQTLSLVQPAAGKWYIGVKCNTTVISENIGPNRSFKYSGKTQVLNGAAYSLEYNEGPATGALAKSASANANEAQPFVMSGDRLVLPGPYRGKAVQVRLFTLAGKPVATALVKHGTASLQKDFGLAPGTYIVKPNSGREAHQL